MFPLSDLAAYVPLIIWLHVLAALAAIVSEEHSEKKDAEWSRRLELLEDAQRKEQIRADSSKCKSNEVDLDFDEPLLANLSLIDPERAQAILTNLRLIEPERSQDESHQWDLDENVVFTPDEYVFKTLSSSGIRGCKDAWTTGTNPPFPWFVYQRTGEYATENETTIWYRADLYVQCNPALDRYAACSAFEHAIKEVSSGCYYRNSEMLYYIDVWHYTYTFSYVQERVVQETRFYADNTHYMTIRQDIPPTYGTRTVK